MMTRKETLEAMIRETDVVWDKFCEFYPRMVRFNPPRIKLCGRIWRTAGYCDWEENLVVLGWKFFQAHADKMARIILPHEIAHQIDYNLRGKAPPEKEFHGPQWQQIMLLYGLQPDEFHNMNIKR